MECPANDTRTALLHAALASFAESGFDGTSIRIRLARDLAEYPIAPPGIGKHDRWTPLGLG